MGTGGNARGLLQAGNYTMRTLPSIEDAAVNDDNTPCAVVFHNRQYWQENMHNVYACHLLGNLAIFR